ncbi:aldehyde dehydrogenase family protein [Acidihalobacter ferrooxydans]|uniref:Aldehyde dehydrogenase n=1 Tax=Acidihalobacter ferrooxydans TaxID=1765967 RepID=A0A1P8UE06_9GAMM|nr:aldehyde dehydrogenase family protein [Acidihalobacter ferrooxydans]APZ42097.1 aldehyde dehydrogenase [Acidihalobacter ferrooxydans]
MSARQKKSSDAVFRDRLFIGGRWVDAVGGGRLPVIDPATEETIHEVPAADAADVDRAVTAARGAFDGGWGGSSGACRAEYLRNIAAAIRARRDELARVEVRDNGKPLPEARWDIDDTADCFEYYAELAEELDGRQGEAVDVGTADFRSTVRYEPVGVVGQIIPWNYPMLMAAWKLAPALAAGATCVLKPSELTPLTALEYGAIAEEIGLPPGVLNVLTGTGADAGAPLSRHSDVDKLAFTGSVPTGMRVMTAAAQDIKNVSLELGGKSPFIVFEDADVEQAVEWIMFGIFWNQGEVCSATSRLLVHEDIAPALLARLKEEAERLPIGNGFDPGVLLGPLVSEGQYRKVRGFIEDGLIAGATVLTGGDRPVGLERGYFLQPTVFTDVREDMRIWREEIFGPVLCVKTFGNESEALRLAHATDYGLAAAVMSAGLERCERVAAALRAGIVWINCSQPTFTQAPWGGMKQSGIGRELGRWGLHNYLEVKQITRYQSARPWGWYLK